MTSPAGTYQIPPPALPPDPAGSGAAEASPVAVGPAADVSPAEASDRAPLCIHCGAVGTHYLTCASLRLPVGYRVAADPATPGSGLTSGPRHPDWPLPPRPAPVPLGPPPTPAPQPPATS